MILSKKSKSNNFDRNILFFTKKSKPKPSIVYETYWRFASERQNIFCKRFNKQAFPWTTDSILTQYKFTNVYRATDRVSQFLINSVIYNGNQDPSNLFFRILLFKLFNRISTWKYLELNLGEISFDSYSFDTYNNLLSNLMSNKIPIYSAAYIMASGKTNFGWEKKHQNHLKLIEKMINDGVPFLLQNCKTMNEAYQVLHSYPTIGDFLAYQYITDFNYSTLTDFSEMEFVKAGPGARDGIMKCFEHFGDYSFEDIIKMMTYEQENEFERLGIKFNTLWGRNLQLIDCQNIFCEVDKYSRIFHPNVNSYSNRTRIKQKFTQNDKEYIDLFFPPKWNINQLTHKENEWKA